MSLSACRTSVQTNKWIKQLRREAAANPKKAAVLGILLVVALVYWAPLVRGWVVGNALAQKVVTEKPPSAVGIVSPGVPGATSPAKPSQEKTATYTWEEWDKWIQQDPRTNPAKDLLGQRDPFHPIQQPVVQKEIKEVKKTRVEPVRVKLTPASLGLQLSSTMVGPSPRLAVVNGKVYREGESIVVSKDGHKVTLTLAEVHARKVVLSSQGERFELSLPERKRSGRLEVSSSQK